MTQLASKRKLWFTISLLVIIPGLLSLLFSGLKLGIDFTGGTLWEVQFSQPAETAQIDSSYIKVHRCAGGAKGGRGSMPLASRVAGGRRRSTRSSMSLGARSG